MNATGLWWSTTYQGIDVIEERVWRNRELYALDIRSPYFDCGDIRRTTLEGYDLVVCKDVIQHWATQEILDWLKHLQAQRFKWALITNCNYGPTVNQDIVTGGWRAIDLLAPPYSIGERVFYWGTKDVVLIEGSLAHG
jgi:hypothetical protein